MHLSVVLAEGRGDSSGEEPGLLNWAGARKKGLELLGKSMRKKALSKTVLMSQGRATCAGKV